MSLSPSVGVKFENDTVIVPRSFYGNPNRIFKHLDSDTNKDVVRGHNCFKMSRETYDSLVSAVDELDTNISELMKTCPHRESESVMFDGGQIQVMDLANTLKSYSRKHKLRMQKIGNQLRSPKDGTLFFGKFGAFSLKKNQISVIAAWKAFVITLLGDTNRIHREFGVDSISPSFAVPDGIHTIEVGVYVAYHGSTFSKKDILSFVIPEWKPPYQVVVCDTYPKCKDTFNVAVVRDATWGCVVCKSFFSTLSDWSSHFDHHVVLPYTSSEFSWRKVNISEGELQVTDKKPSLSISMPCMFFTHGSYPTRNLDHPGHEWYIRLIVKSADMANELKSKGIYNKVVEMALCNKLNADTKPTWATVNTAIRCKILLRLIDWEILDFDEEVCGEYGLEFPKVCENSTQLKRRKVGW